jgi:phosphatidylinositol alpha 1,6-mannosyltransferase
LRVARPALNLRPLLADLAPDVVHLASPVILGAAAASAAQALGLPAVAVFQTDLAALLRRYRLGPLASPLWRHLQTLHGRTDLTLAPSTSTLYALRANGIGPVAMWARGVDTNRFHPRHRSERQHAQFAGVGTFVVGFVGRLAAEKRVELLEPVSRLAGVQLVVVGDGPSRAALQRLMPAATFLGLQTGPDLSRIMASLDLLINPGKDETFCQVVQEALASGVPVITAASGGPLDLVRHGENGWLWSGDDPAVLAAQVASVRADRTEYTAAQVRTRESVVARTWATVGDELLSYYGRVIAEHSRRVRAEIPTAIRAPKRVRRSAS